jgi:hypothetical protein
VLALVDPSFRNLIGDPFDAHLVSRRGVYVGAQLRLPSMQELDGSFVGEAFELLKALR